MVDHACALVSLGHVSEFVQHLSDLQQLEGGRKNQSDWTLKQG